CGNACANGLCVNGTCEPSLPRVLAQGSTYGALAVDATAVYYADTGASTIAKVQKTGGTPTVLATGESNVTAIAVDGTSVYWLGGATNTIKKVAKAGGTVQ